VAGGVPPAVAQHADSEADANADDGDNGSHYVNAG
jgi:hypothetical protein